MNAPDQLSYLFAFIEYRFIQSNIEYQNYFLNYNSNSYSFNAIIRLKMIRFDNYYRYHRSYIVGIVSLSCDEFDNESSNRLDDANEEEGVFII